MEQNPCEQKGGDISTVIGAQLLWIGPYVPFHGLLFHSHHVQRIFNRMITAYIDPFFDIQNWFEYYLAPLGFNFALIGLGTILTVIGAVCVANWVKLYHRDLAWERKMGYSNM